MSSLSYRPAWWVPGPHAQTLWGKLVRRPAIVPTRHEQWDTPDGDTLHLHRLDAPTPDAPRLLILHGLEGSIHSHYVQGLLSQAQQRGWGADVLIFRSCGGIPNRTRRFYHSGETTDFSFVLQRISGQYPEAPLLAAGISLGGNVLLKFLGEHANTVAPSLQAAAAVSVPFDLSRGSKYLQYGFARVYEKHFLKSLKEKVRTKLPDFPDLIDPAALQHIHTLYDFDDQLTAPIHGFRDAADYYTQSSAIHYLPNISIKTILLSAYDDPFLPSDVLHTVKAVAQGNSALTLDFVERGGHAGFVAGRNPFRPHYYLEHRLGEFLASHLHIKQP